MTSNDKDPYMYLDFEIFSMLNPIPTSQGRNQPLYERHVTKSGRNRVNKGMPTSLYRCKK